MLRNREWDRIGSDGMGRDGIRSVGTGRERLGFYIKRQPLDKTAPLIYRTSGNLSSPCDNVHPGNFLFQVSTGAYVHQVFSVPSGEMVNDPAVINKITWASWTRSVLWVYLHRLSYLFIYTHIYSCIVS